MKKLLLSVSVLFLTGVILASTIEWKSDLNFSHKFHISEAEAECSSCHELAEKSTSGTDDLLPQMETCYNCHDQEMDCAICHENPDEPVILARVESYVPKFNHQIHIKGGIKCTDCHIGIQEKETVESGLHLPKMQLCMTCHETPASKDGCYSCHQNEENLKPADHVLGWQKNHGLVAESGQENCKSCHTENFCINCHQGENVMNESHPPQFLVTHGISYMMRESDCAGCHESKQFCVDCHMHASSALPADHRQAEWAGPGHGASARMDYDRCTVCHQADDLLCTQCHN